MTFRKFQNEDKGYIKNELSWYTVQCSFHHQISDLHAEEMLYDREIERWMKDGKMEEERGTHYFIPKQK